jgi:hypothetical protein
MESVHATRLPPWCLRLARELDAADARAIALTSDLNITQLNWKPRPDAWSVGQCLEHLCISNEVYVKPIERSLEGAPTAPVEEITPGWFGRWFIRNFIDPATQKKRVRAPRKIVPVAKHIDSSIVERFTASNAKVRDLIALGSKHDVNRVRFKNPLVSVIRFTVGTGLELIARHNHRHLLQAERVKNLAEFPKS